VFSKLRLKSPNPLTAINRLIKDDMYEIVPGFIANSLTIFLINIMLGQKNQMVLKQYEEVTRAVAAKKQLS